MSGENVGFQGLPKVGIHSIYVTNNTPQNGTAVDCRGYSRLAAVVSFGNVTASAAETITVKLQAGDQSDGSDAADISGATTTAITVSNSIDNTIQAIILIDLLRIGKRYVRAVATLSAVTTLMNCNVIFLLGVGQKTVGSADVSQFVNVLSS